MTKTLALLEIHSAPACGIAYFNPPLHGDHSLEYCCREDLAGWIEKQMEGETVTVDMIEDDEGVAIAFWGGSFEDPMVQVYI